MRNRFGRVSGAIAAATALSVIGGAAAVAQPASRPETSLLGVTLLKSSYRDVLKRFGRPDEIQAGGPFVPNEGAPSNRAASGGGGQRGGSMMSPMGGQGMPGMSPMGGQGMAGMPGGGGSGGGGGGKRATSKTGFPGRSGTGASGPAGGQGMGPATSGGGQGMMGGMGLPGFGGGGMAGYPGMGGQGGGNSGDAAAGAPAMPGTSGNSGGASGGPAADAEAPEYEATWWYHDKTNGLHKSFLFNKDGRVIQIQEYGYDKNHKGSKTRLGVGLGSGLNTVLRSYGWSNDGANDGQNMIMRFGGEQKVAFQLVKNVVVGITVAIVKDVRPTEAQ